MRRLGCGLDGQRRRHRHEHERTMGDEGLWCGRGHGRRDHRRDSIHFESPHTLRQAGDQILLAEALLLDLAQPGR